jgi:DNA-directed RNA polymerase subunit N (RpoN/RPB10)
LSDDWLQIIATDPMFVPDEAAARTLSSLVHTFAPNAERVDVIDEGKIVFIDAGENFETVRCNSCGAVLDLDWWSDQMNSAQEHEFSDLATTTPCCRQLTTLNNLDYDWPQGFARWRIEVLNPSVGRLTPEAELALSDAVGHAVRLIYTHL